MSKMSGKQFILEVIEMYRESPCLWKVSHHDYHDKNKRIAALEQLLELFQKVDPSANKDTVQRKIASLRGAFKKELNKVKTSMRFGAGVDQIHVPKLWYYNHMLFLEEMDSTRPSKAPCSALDIKFEEIEETYDEDVLSSPQSQASTSLSEQSCTKETSFKRTKAMADLGLTKISKKQNTIDMAKLQKEKEDTSDAFGQYVASELRALPEIMKHFCKKVINDAIFQAAMGQLNFTSRVVTDEGRGK